MDTENNIKENCLKIKIERNSYKNGALIFSIFNSETGHYDKANDLSDQNPLLKFTSETKELSEYADELILKLIETYKRLDTVQILFRGIPEDYSILSDSLNRNAGQNTGFVIIPNNYMSPGDLCDFVNKCVDTLNKKVKTINSSSAMISFNEYTKLNVNIPPIDRIDMCEDAKTVFAIIKDKSDELRRLVEFVSKQLSEVDKAINNLKKEISAQTVAKEEYIKSAVKYYVNLPALFDKKIEALVKNVMLEIQTLISNNASFYLEFQKANLYNYEKNAIGKEIKARYLPALKKIIADYIKEKCDTECLNYNSFCSETMNNPEGVLKISDDIIELATNGPDTDITNDEYLKIWASNGLLASLNNKHIVKERQSISGNEMLLKIESENIEVGNKLLRETCFDFGKMLEKSLKISFEENDDNIIKKCNENIESCKEVIHRITDLIAEIERQKITIESTIKTIEEGK